MLGEVPVLLLTLQLLKILTLVPRGLEAIQAMKYCFSSAFSKLLHVGRAKGCLESWGGTQGRCSLNGGCWRCFSRCAADCAQLSAGNCCCPSGMAWEKLPQALEFVPAALHQCHQHSTRPRGRGACRCAARWAEKGLQAGTFKNVVEEIKGEEVGGQSIVMEGPCVFAMARNRAAEQDPAFLLSKMKPQKASSPPCITAGWKQTRDLPGSGAVTASQTRQAAAGAVSWVLHL